MDFAQVKQQRATQRARTLSKKRADYARSKQDSCLPSQLQTDEGAKQSKRREHSCSGHGMARAAMRRSLARGIIEDVSDMPSLSTGSKMRPKPSVPSPLLTFKIEASDTLDTTSTDCSDIDTSDFGLDEPHPFEVYEKTASIREATLSVDSVQEEESDVELPEVKQEEPASIQHEAPETTRSRREEVLIGLVNHLRAKEIENQRRAEEAARQLAEVNAVSAVASARKPNGQKVSSDIQIGLKLAQKQAAEVRRKQNQEAIVQSMKDKADKVLQDAQRLKEQAEVRATEEVAKRLAEAEAEAKRIAEAHVREELTKAQAAAEALVQQGLAEVAAAEVAAKAQMEAEALQAREAALRRAKALEDKAEELRLTAEFDAKQLRTRAEIEARVIKARAEQKATELKEAAEAAEREKLEAAAAAEKAAKAKALIENVAALKKGKELAQQLAKERRRQAEQEKLKEKEAEAARAKVALELEAAKTAAWSLQVRMQEEMKEKAKAAAAKAQREAERIRREAEEEAAQIRQELEKERARVQLELSMSFNVLSSQADAEPAQVVDSSWELLPSEMHAEEANADWNLVD